MRGNAGVGSRSLSISPAVTRRTKAVIMVVVFGSSSVLLVGKEGGDQGAGRRSDRLHGFVGQEARGLRDCGGRGTGSPCVGRGSALPAGSCAQMARELGWHAHQRPPSYASELLTPRKACPAQAPGRCVCRVLLSTRAVAIELNRLCIAARRYEKQNDSVREHGCV